ncbi:DUF3810 domain-containing protein [Halosquirtibacter laminarini]|uniref:DUF3810 domain-containing protein n=1 Tax=Halosquirtibacter laminarini TaxID=3374600 RepID=A0AC61NI18_9BACT|nr:DUF3810 domain-containing protein [Prolixibacteraceae bacterium]
MLKLFIQRFRGVIILGIVLCIQYLISRYSSSCFIESYYLKYVYSFVGNISNSLSSLVSISLWELFWVFFILFIIVLIVLSFIKKSFWKRSLKYFVFVLLIGANWFYISWGYSYGRRSMIEVMDINTEGLTKSDVEDAFHLILKDISDMSMDALNWTTPVDQALIAEYRDQMDREEIPLYVNPHKIKKITFSKFYIQAGVLGFFGPFFNEVHVNRYLYEKDYPYVAFHELSHQQGVGSERDCNFIAFILAYHSQDKSLRYSAYLNILPYFIDYFYQYPQEEFNEMVRTIPSYLISDLRSRSYWYRDQRDEFIDRVQSKANDIYLKSNGVEDGVMNYGKYFGMVVFWINQDSNKIAKNKS